MQWDNSKKKVKESKRTVIMQMSSSRRYCKNLTSTGKMCSCQRNSNSREVNLNSFEKKYGYNVNNNNNAKQFYFEDFLAKTNPEIKI